MRAFGVGDERIHSCVVSLGLGSPTLCCFSKGLCVLNKFCVKSPSHGMCDISLGRFSGARISCCCGGME